MPLDRLLLADYFSTKTNRKRHHYYDRTVEKAEAFAPHADGVYPEKLIGERRPNETDEVKLYRKEIWKAKTKPTFGRIVSSLGKIRRSADWSIKYPGEEFGKIEEGETLEDYCEHNFPYFTSATNWAFSVLLKKYLTDPNAVCLVSLLNQTVEEDQFNKPYPFLFDSKDVVEFVDDNFCILNDINGAGAKNKKWTAFYYIDTFVIERWIQVDDRGTHSLDTTYEHGLNELPAFKLGAIIVEAEGLNFLHASRIEDVLIDFDECLREYSDLQAAKVLHMYPERWEFTSAECPACNHTGFRPNPLSEQEGQPNQIPCSYPGCTGGYIANGPYSKLLVRPTDSNMGNQNSPIPPAGYITKDIEIIKIMESSVERHQYDGLAAINFQFLDQSPLNQSGVAKEVDKDELNNTVHAIAEDIVRILDSIYRLIAFYRYAGLYSQDEIIEMLPSIPVPEKFDILSANYLGEELERGKKGLANPAILNALELEYASKKFNTNSEVRDRLELVLQLDPFSNISQDDKTAMLSNKGITQLSYVISSNIHSFVQRAIEEDANFAALALADQVEKMNEYAQEVVDAQDTAKPIVADVVSETGLGDEEMEEPIIPNTDAAPTADAVQ